MTDLRVRLRAETASSHARLDAALVTYDLTNRSDLSDYLSVHYLARLQIAVIVSEDAARLSNQQKLADIRSDLEVLSLKPPQCMKRSNSTSYHPLGLTYVMSGSSLGSKLLYKHWATATDTIVQQAGTFITNSKDSSEWTFFLAHVKTLKVSHDEVSDIVASANSVFEIFEAANDQVKRSR